MPRVLITGASGFIGRHVVASLVAKGADVRALGRGEPPAFLPPSVTWHRIDLLQAGKAELEAAVAQARAPLLVHLAWGNFAWTNLDSLEHVAWLGASVDLLQAFLESGGRRVVATGSCIEYDAPEHGPCLETSTATRPRQLYSIAKDALRRVLARLHEGDRIDFAWARLFYPFGPYDKPVRLVPSLVDALLEGREAECSSGSQIKDFIDVRDCGAAIAALVMSQVSGEVNIGSGQAMSLGDFVSRIGMRLGASHRIRLGALPDRPEEPRNLWADTGRLHREVKFVPSYDLDQSITHTIEGRRDLGKKGGPVLRATRG